MSGANAFGGNPCRRPLPLVNRAYPPMPANLPQKRSKASWRKAAGGCLGPLLLNRTDRGRESNPTYFVTLGERRMVLRKKPGGRNAAFRPRRRPGAPSALGPVGNRRSGAEDNSLL